MKTNKSYTKRLRITKKGKVVARTPGHNHFNARQSPETRLRRNRANIIDLKAKDRARFLPHS